MAGIKISDLPAVPSAQLTDVFPVDQGITTYKESNSQLLTLFQSNGTALTKTNDTNVTMVLGGSPTTALLNATSMTLGWIGTLSGTRGGTGVNNGASTLTLGGSLTTSGAFASTFTMTAPTSVTFPTSGTLATTAGTVSSVSGTLNRITSTGGTTPVIDISASYVGQSSITTVGALTSGSLTTGFTPVTVPLGGTGNTTFTAYSVICAGTTATGAFQNVVGLGNSGEQLTSNGAGLLPTWQPSSTVTPSALTKVDDANVTVTLGGTPTTALLQATSLTMGWSGQLSPARGGTGVNNGTNTLTLAGNLSTSGAFASAFTMTGVTNVTFPTSGTLATTGQLPTPAALTKVDDTNVTLTLGGTPNTALLQATSLTLGWTGQLSLARGGTNANLTASNGGIFYSTASAGAILSGTATANQILMSGSSAAPAWSTATYPATGGSGGSMLRSTGTNWANSTFTMSPTYAVNTIVYAGSTNGLTGLATANSATFFTTSSGVPGWTGSMTNGQLLIGSTGTSPALGTITAGTNISITNAAGSITINSTGAASFAWNNVASGTQALVANQGYITNNGASLVTYTLPATAAQGTIISIAGFSTGGWALAQNASQQIFFGNQSTTAGVGGSLASTNRNDQIDLLCVTANLTWVVRNALGNLTFV